MPGPEQRPPQQQQEQDQRPWWQRALNWGGQRLDELGSIAGDVGGVLGPAAGDIARTAGRNIPDVGPLGNIGDIASGTGKLLNWDEQGNWDPNWGGVGDIVNGGAGFASDAGKLAPGVGSLIGGGAQAITNGYQAYNKFSAMANETDPARRAALEREAWGATGDATIGALHAGIGSWCPVADLYISAGELALDGVGTLAGWAGGEDAKFGAGDVVGGLLDAVIPEEEDAWSNQAGRWVDQQLGGGTLGLIGGATAAGLTNVVTAPVNIADATAGGIVNTIGNIFDSDRGERDDYWGQFKGWTGDRASDAWNWTQGAANDAWDWGTNTWNDVSSGATDLWNRGTQWAGDTWNDVSTGATNLWNQGTEAVGNAWNSGTQWASDTWNDVSTGATNLWNRGTEAVGNAWNSGTQWASDTWNDVSTGATNAWNRGTEAVGNAWNTVSTGATNAWNSGVEAAGNAWNRGTEAVGNAWNSGTEAVGNAASSAWKTVSSW